MRHALHSKWLSHPSPGPMTPELRSIHPKGYVNPMLSNHDLVQPSEVVYNQWNFYFLKDNFLVLFYLRYTI